MRKVFYYGDPFYDEFMDIFSFSPNLKVYNPNEYELKPKDGVIQRRITEKEEQMRRIESQKKLEMEGWDNRIQILKDEIDSLKKKL